MNRVRTKSILITGASGQLGVYLLQELNRRHIDNVHAWSGKSSGHIMGVDLQPVALEDRSQVETQLDSNRPDVIIHAGAVSSAEEVRRNPSHGRLVNVEGTRTLAEWCGRNNARLIFTSTDLVFDGSKSGWTEEDTASPILEYGRRKAEAENLVTNLRTGLVARVSLLYGPTLTGRPSFFTSCLDALRNGVPRSLFTDEWRTPLDYLSAAEALCELALDKVEVHGIVHVGGTERMSRYELILRAAKECGIDLTLMQPASVAETVLPEARPRDVSLSTAKLRRLLPHLKIRSVEEVVSAMRQ